MLAYQDERNDRRAREFEQLRRDADNQDAGVPTPLRMVLGMFVATICGSAFVIGGLMVRASGPVAILLAAAVPLAGVLWAITISLGGRGGG